MRNLIKCILIITYMFMLVQTPAAANYTAAANPELAVTHSQSATADPSPAATVTSYPDVQETDWYYSNVMALTKLGVLQGSADGLFHYDNLLTVGEFLKMIGEAVYPQSVPKMDNDSIILNDGNSISKTHWSSKYYAAAVLQGVITQDEYINEASDLDTKISRYQMSVILTRITENVMGEEAVLAENLENFIADYSTIPQDYLPYVLTSYSKGLLQGDANRSFSGSEGLTRAAAATVVMRLVDPQCRPQTDFSAIPPSPAEPVTDDWFSDAIFIGDSLTQGLSIFSGLTTPQYLCYQSVSAANFHSYKCLNNLTQTIPQGLSGVTGTKVFVMLGINDLGTDVSTYKTRYEKVLDTVAKALPNAKIYIQSVTPVSAAKSAQSTTINKTWIQKYNTCLEELAQERGISFIDVYSALADENGDLPSAGTGWDGAHLSTAYYVKWHDFLNSVVSNF